MNFELIKIKAFGDDTSLQITSSLLCGYAASEGPHNDIIYAIIRLHLLFI